MLSCAAVIIKTVKGARPNEVAALRRQLDEQEVEHSICEGIPDEPPRTNFRRLLAQGAASERDYLIHLEDDIYLCPEFAAGVADRLRTEVANLWTFYDARQEAIAALATGQTYRRITPGAFRNTQAVAFATALIPSLLRRLPEWETAHPEHRSAVDCFLGWFCRVERLIICASVPPLVQHRQVPSLLGHRKQYGRISRAFTQRWGPIPGGDDPC